MGLVWRANNEGGWQPVVLNGMLIPLADLEGDQANAATRSTGEESRAMLMQHPGSGTGEGWALLAGPGDRVFVNGQPLLAGIRVLHDRDEIRRWGSRELFFATEKLACVVEFPGADHSIHCPRCSQEILPGMLAVQCPNTVCQIWHHQTSERPCWTYTDHCALCEQPTALGQDYRWRPGED